MKLDSESLYNNSHPSNEHDTKVIIHNEIPFILAKENHFVIDMRNVEKEFPNDEKRVLFPTNDRKNPNINDAPKQYLNIEDFINCKNSDEKGMEELHSAHASDFEVALKEDFYADKIVAKEDFYHRHSVRDISVDEEVKSFTKSLAQKEELGLTESSISNKSLENDHDNSTSEMAGSSASDDTRQIVFDIPVTNADTGKKGPASDLHDNFEDKGEVDTTESMLSNEKNDSASSIYNEGVLDTTGLELSKGKNSSLSIIENVGVLNTDEKVLVNQFSEVTENQLRASEKSMADLSYMDSSSQVVSNDEKLSNDTQNDQAKPEGSNSTCITLAELIKESTEAPANHSIPGGVISFSFDKEEATSTSGRSEIEEIAENPQSELAHNEIDSASTSTRCSFRHLIQREPNLSGPDIMSGPIVNSGHIPYSGSISFRSESSTTSARSFAFPILQSEWNSSPVKMKKAKRKHRGWRMGLVCCRF